MRYMEPPFLFFTMVTTFHNTVFQTRSSTWSKPKKYAMFVKSKILRWCFCIDDQLLDTMLDECELRDGIREAMVVHVPGTGTGAVRDCMKEVYNETAYDMSNFAQIVEEVKPVVSEDLHILVGDLLLPVENGDQPNVVSSEPVRTLETEGLKDMSHVQAPSTAMVVPKFAAAVVLCLRAKFGNLQLTDANRLLIEREYLKVCRENSVRNVDVVMHQQCILNAYFMEGVMEEVCTVRTRVPRWLREAFGSVPRASPTVC